MCLIGFRVIRWDFLCGKNFILGSFFFLVIFLVIGYRVWVFGCFG